MRTSSNVCCFKAPSVAILTSLRPTVIPLLGYSSGKPIQDPLARGFVLKPNSTFSASHFDPRESGRRPQLITPENGGGDETSSTSPPISTFFDDPDVPLGPWPPGPPPAPPGLPDPPGLPPGWPPSSATCWWEGAGRGGGREWEPKMHRVSDHVRDLRHRSLNLIQFQLVMAILICHHWMGDNGNGPDRVIEYILPHKRHPMVVQEPVIVLDEDPAVVNPSSPSPGPSPSVEQRGHSRRQQRSRSRERAPPHKPPHASQQPQPAAPPPSSRSKTMKNLKMSLELSQTISPLCHFFLSSKDQLPVHKEHRPVPTLRMNTLRTKTTSVEMSNLVQQYKVHEVMTPERQCSIQTSLFRPMMSTGH